MESQHIWSVRELVSIANSDRFVVLSGDLRGCQSEARRLAELIDCAQRQGHDVERYADPGEPIDLRTADAKQLFGAAIGVRRSR